MHLVLPWEDGDRALWGDRKPGTAWGRAKRHNPGTGQRRKFGQTEGLRMASSFRLDTNSRKENRGNISPRWKGLDVGDSEVPMPGRSKVWVPADAGKIPGHSVLKMIQVQVAVVSKMNSTQQNDRGNLACEREVFRIFTRFP